MNRERIYELMFRIWWWARVYALYAAILFAILWGVAMFSGCANDAVAPVAQPAHAMPLSRRLSSMMEEMRQAGCWPMTFSLTYSCPTSYSISVSGNYYDRLDYNRTNTFDNAKKGN